MHFPLSAAFCSLFFILFAAITQVHASSEDPTMLNGGSAMAMAGDECVALAVDKRFGSGPQMVNVSPRRILTPHSHLMVAFAGLEGDIITLSEELSIHAANKFSSGIGFGFDEKRRSSISPRAMASLTSHVLYSKRSAPFYCEPLIVGLEPTENDDSSTMNNKDTCSRRQYRPFLCSQDIIGAKSLARDFACCGVAEKSLYGTAEAMWRPNLKPEELVRVCGRAFLSALERDCLSGYGAVVYLMTKDGIVEFDLECRND